MKPKYVDVHTHTHFAAYDEDRKKVIERALEAGVWMIQVGTQRDTSESAVALANGYPEGVYATVGLHPIHTEKSYHDTKETGEGGSKGFTSRGEDFDYAYYKKLADDPKVVAIGECGLDYYRLHEDTKKKQRDIFERQIALSLETGKPLMLHIRDAYEDALDILRAHEGVRGNVHFFAGSWEVATQFLDLGFMLSFTGVITFTSDYDEVVRNAPLGRLLSETDAPYVAPAPYRGKRNEPAYVAEVVARIALIRGEDESAVRAALVRNAAVVFDLPLGW